MKCMMRSLVSSAVACVCAVLLVPVSVAEAQWQNPVIDTLTNTQVQKGMTLQSLCLDDSDMVHIVWHEQVSGGWRVFYCTNSPSGTWGTPQVVGDTVYPASDPAAVWYLPEFSFAVPFIVYEQSSNIHYTYLFGGSFLGIPITVNSQLDCSPTIATDSFACVHAAWITDDSVSGQYKIAYALGWWTCGTVSWSVQILSGSELGPYGTGASPFIAATPDGVAHIVYRGGFYTNYHIHHAWNNAPGDTAWNYETLYSGNANDFSSSMVIEGDYDIHLAMAGNDGWGFPGRVYYMCKPHGQSWQPYSLASQTYSATEPSISVDSDGDPHIVWMETSGNFYTGNIFYSGLAQSGNWQVSSVIGGDHFFPSFMIDGQDYGHVACHTGGNTGLYDIYHVKSSGMLAVEEDFEYSSVSTVPWVQSRPNPFNGYTEITYGIPYPGRVTLSVYNSAGERVAVLYDGFTAAGTRKALWRPHGLSAGIYFLRLATDRSSLNAKCVLLP